MNATKRVIRRERPRPEPARSQDLAAVWPEADRPAVDFVQLCSDRLPVFAFHLRPGEFVARPEIYFRRLRENLAAGPEGPCAKSAIRDCRRLQELYGRGARRLPR